MHNSIKHTSLLHWVNEGNTVIIIFPGHFTQLVWKDSKFVGFGYARKGGKTFVTANYDPPGNYVGMFESNVIYGKGPLTRLEQNKPTHKKEEKQGQYICWN